MAIRSLSVRTTILAVLAMFAALSGASILADPTSPVTITDVDTPDPVASGQQITHSITIVNTGGAKISNVVMSDQLNGVGGIGVPPQLQIASSRGSCAQSGTLVTCNGGNIEGNGSWTISIRGIVTAANGTVLNNTVSVTGTKSAQNFTTTNTSTTLVSNGGNNNLPELSINKTGPTSVIASQPMTYTLTVNNTGTQNAFGVKVMDTMPAGITAISATGTSLFSCGVAGQTVTCDGGAVNQGSNATITINATAPAALGQITNTAVVDPDNTIAETNELNNTSALVNTQVIDLPPAPDLGINITDDPSVITGAGPSDPVTPGAALTFKILVTNNAATRADDVVTVLGTQGLEASSVVVNQVVTNGAVGTSGGCTIVAPQAKCVVRSLNPGGTILMSVSGYVIGFAGSGMISTATVTGNIKNKGVTATDTELTTVMPQYDLTVTKAGDPNPVCASSWPGPGYPAGPGAPLGPDYPAGNTCQGGLIYTFVVGNSGLQTATGVTLRDPLPAGVVFDSFSNVDGGGFNCTYNNVANVVTCTDGIVPGQSTRTVKFVVVPPNGVGAITNTVTVDPNNAIFEADESNNMFTQVNQVATGIDLTVSKHSDHEANFVATRGTLTYTIKVSNVGTQDSTNIVVRDALPADTLFRDAVSDPAHGFTCSQAGGIVECINGHIQGTKSMNYPNLAGTAVDTATITIRIFATAYEQAAMHNEVRVDPANQITEVNENNNLAVQNTQVKSGGTTNDAFNELIISKEQTSPDPTNTARNAVVTYTVRVGNDASDPVVGVKVRDTLPAGAKYIEATGTNSFLCNQTGLGVIDCVGGQIAANALLTDPAKRATITIKAFAPDTPATYTNQVEVDPDHTIAEGNEFNNNASATTKVVNGGAGSFHELSVKKEQISPNKANTARNAIVTYTITVKNTGSDAVNGVVVRDKLPAGARYIQANGDHQFLCTEAQTGIIDCVNGQVDGGGGTATITLTMFAPDTPGDYVNQVNVDPDNAIPEGDEFNNQAIETTTVANGGDGDFNDLSITKVADPSPVKPNETLTYTLTVSNTQGQAPAQNVKVRDVLSSYVTFISATDAGPGAFTCSEASNVVTCVGGTIAAGGNRTITIKVKAPNLVDVSLINNAMVDPENEIPEGNESNNNFTLSTLVSSNINLTIKKDGPKTSSQGDVATYKITIENQSPSATGVGTDAGQMAFNVEVHDPLPVGLIPLAVDTGSNNNFQCQVLENPINLVDCVGDLPPDSPVEISIDVFMTAEGSRALDNEACIDPADTIKEYTKTSDGTLGETDNCSTHTALGGTPPKRSPNFLITKSVNQSVASPGEQLEYSISVSNIGDADHKGLITVTDDLSNDTTAVNIIGPNGWTCSTPADTMTCDNSGLSGDDQILAVGATVQFTVHATVNADANGQLVNGATVSNAIHDPSDSGAEDETAANQANNSATAKTTVGEPGKDLAIGTITDNPDPVVAGGQVTYTVVAVNAGTQAESNVHVKLTMPSGVSYVGADGSNGFNCDAPVGSLIDCHTTSMPAGGNTTITAKFLVLLSPPGTLTLSAHIDPRTGETNTSNNDMSQTTTVSGSVCTTCVDLVAAEMIASPEPVTSGNSVTVKWVIVNTGDTPSSLSTNPSDNEQIAFFDMVANPSPGGGITGVSFAYSAPGVTCTTISSGANFRFNDCFGNVGPGQSVVITATITGVTGSDLFVTGTIDPNGKQTEFKEDNNFLQQTVVIQ